MRYGIIPPIASLALFALSLVSPAVHAQTAPAQTTLQQPPPLRALLTGTVAIAPTPPFPGTEITWSWHSATGSPSFALQDTPLQLPWITTPTSWNVTLASGESYSDVALVELAGHSLLIGDDEERRSIPIDQIVEFQRRNYQSRTVLYGQIAGIIAGCVAAAVDSSGTPASLIIIGGYGGGGVLRLLTGIIFRPDDDVYDLRGMSPQERVAMIAGLVSEGRPR